MFTLSSPCSVCKREFNIMSNGPRVSHLKLSILNTTFIFHFKNNDNNAQKLRFFMTEFFLERWTPLRWELELHYWRLTKFQVLGKTAWPTTTDLKPVFIRESPSRYQEQWSRFSGQPTLVYSMWYKLTGIPGDTVHRKITIFSSLLPLQTLQNKHFTSHYLLIQTEFSTMALPYCRKGLHYLLLQLMAKIAEQHSNRRYWSSEHSRDWNRRNRNTLTIFSKNRLI